MAQVSAVSVRKSAHREHLGEALPGTSKCEDVLLKPVEQTNAAQSKPILQPHHHYCSQCEDRVRNSRINDPDDYGRHDWGGLWHRNNEDIEGNNSRKNGVCIRKEERGS